jgi:hypothetical protein
MPLHKNIKKDENFTIQMLDTKHNEYITQFHEENKIIIPRLMDELHQEKDEHKKKSILRKIKCIEAQQLDYYLTNSNHIFSYFEEKKEISECKSFLPMSSLFSIGCILIGYFFVINYLSFTLICLFYLSF